MPDSLLSPRKPPVLQKLREKYHRFFSITEIESNVTLQWFFGAMLFFFYVTFYQWITSRELSADIQNVCWPYFPDCNALHFLSASPFGYSQSIFYMALFAVMLGIVYCMYRKWWTSGHALLLILFIWKLLASFLLSWNIAGVYDYYHLILTAALLFVPFKEYFLKVLFVLLYFLSATIKFYPTWVLGTYFTTLQLGLPILPDALTPIITNSVILEQVIGCWFLLSKHRLTQRLTLLYFLTFHLYGGILVLYNYSSITLPVLLILFGPRYRHQFPPISKRSIAGWTLVTLTILFQMPVHFIASDEKITMEGYRFGMWMFDANHQCVANFKVVHRPEAKNFVQDIQSYPFCNSASCLTGRIVSRENNRWVETYRVESPRAEVRCAPYTFWQGYRRLCDGESVERVAFTFDHSINGGPFYRIVDEPDMCDLSFSTFGHNAWIKTPPEAPVIGFPVKNIYY